MDRTHASHELEENTISRFIFLNWDKVTSKEQNSHSDTDISKNRIIHHKKWGSKSSCDTIGGFPVIYFIINLKSHNQACPNRIMYFANDSRVNESIREHNSHARKTVSKQTTQLGFTSKKLDGPSSCGSKANAELLMFPCKIVRSGIFSV